MTLYSWAEWNESASVHELHGDLEIRLPLAPAEAIAFAFCFGFDTGFEWDCLFASTGINADRIDRDSVYASSFVVLDMYAKGVSSREDLQLDPQGSKLDDP